MIYAIGDIHGCFEALGQAQAYLFNVLNPEDTVVFIGDYVDRGPDSKGCVDLLIAFGETHGRTVFLRGNHEQMLLDAKRDGRTDMCSDDFYLWWMNGGDETARSYGVPRREIFGGIPADHWEFYERTQMEYREGLYIFVHAGRLGKGETWEGEESRDPRLWIREPFLSSEEDYDGRVVVFGHTPQRRGRPLVKPNKIGIDTGCVFGFGGLTVAILDPTKDRDVEFKQFGKVAVNA